MLDTRSAPGPRLMTEDTIRSQTPDEANPLALSRRVLLAAPLGLMACRREAQAQVKPGAAPPFKSLVRFPVGTCGMTGQFDDPAWVALARRNFSQFTPEWEMKMEAVLSPQGTYDFTVSDRIVRLAREIGLNVHATTLIWYSQQNAWFDSLPASRFAAAYDQWIATMAGRYRGQVRGWDVVNEAVAEDGNGLRDCLWSRRLGPDGYIVRAFEQARAADPSALLFLNDYNLENLPRKLDTFLRLVERLLRAGAPVTGLGTQSHLDIEIPAGQIRRSIEQLAQFGLPIHVSELDASLRREGGPPDLRSPGQRTAQQTARVEELADAFAALPARQQYAFTVWGVRDTDSWYRRGDKDDGRDSPLLFNSAGQPNPMMRALIDGFGAG